MSTPLSIDIYTDGCKLQQGKDNPAAPGGWGAVIVAHGEMDDRVRLLMGSDRSIHHARDAETLAIIKSLQSVKHHEFVAQPVKPAITLHTDQDALIEHMTRIRHGDQPHAQGHYNQRQWQEIADLSRQMEVEFQSDRDPKHLRGTEKDTSFMTLAHELASSAAWKERLQTQHYITFKGSGTLRGDAAHEIIHRRILQLGYTPPGGARSR